MTPTEYRVIISPRAYADLDAILTYIAQSSPQNAGKVIDRLLNQIQSLKYFPRRCRVTPQAREPDLSLRTLTVRPFLVDFRIREEARVVQILAVTHGARRR